MLNFFLTAIAVSVIMTILDVYMMWSPYLTGWWRIDGVPVYFGKGKTWKS